MMGGREAGGDGGTDVHWEKKSIFAPVEEKQRRADAQGGGEQTNQQSPAGCFAPEKRGEAEPKSQHLFTTADERHRSQRQQQERRSNHLFFDKVTQGGAMLVRLCQPGHELKFEEVSSQISTDIEYCCEAQLVIPVHGQAGKVGR